MSDFNGIKNTEYMDGRDLQTGTLAKGSILNIEFNRLYGNDNWLKAHQEAHSASSITEADRVHGIRQGTGNGFDADMLDGLHAGNASGSIPVNNSILCTDLNADKLDGQHGSYYTAASDFTFHASSAITSSNTVHGIKQGSGNNFDADTVDGYHAGNAANQVPVNNGTLCINLNADMVDGYQSTDITPVGTINAYLPGYFSGDSNNGFNAVALTLPANWKVCDGSACNDTASPIFNGAGRYLPNLTDSRFIMGGTVAGAGATGGNASNQVILAAGNLPSHQHTNSHTHTFSGSTVTVSTDHSHSYTAYSSYVYGAAAYQYGEAPFWGSQYAAGTGGMNANANHGHAYSGTTSDASAATGYTGSGSAFSILPKYLSAVYIMRIK